VLLCADREEDDGHSKREIDKIYQIQNVPGFDIFIATAGLTSISTNLCVCIHENFIRAVNEGVDILNDHQAILEYCLKLIHEKYASEINNSPIHVITVVAPHASDRVPMVYGNDREILIPTPLYVSYGSGKGIADYLSDRMYTHGRFDKGSLAVLAAFIFREAERSSLGVGLGVDMVFIQDHKKQIHSIAPKYVSQLQSSIPDLQDCVLRCWEKDVQIPDWIRNR
jgi:20S proteasome alpha/beta subunit